MSDVIDENQVSLLQNYEMSDMINEKRVYLLIGITGKGKSTTGNVAINESSDFELITKEPFETSDNSQGCTVLFQAKSNDQIHVIDTAGFCDSKADPEQLLKEFRTALETVQYKINCVLFVTNVGRFTQQDVKFFELMQQKVLQNKCKNNSILIVTGSDKKDWVEKQIKTDQYFREVYLNCNNCSYEFDLKLKVDDVEDENDKQQLLETYKRVNQRSIDKFTRFLKEKNFVKIDLSDIKTDAYTSFWMKVIIPTLAQILSQVIPGPPEVIKKSVNQAGKKMEIFFKGGWNACKQS
jgi:hypothetical protein